MGFRELFILILMVCCVSTTYLWRNTKGQRDHAYQLIGERDHYINDEVSKIKSGKQFILHQETFRCDKTNGLWDEYSHQN